MFDYIRRTLNSYSTSANLTPQYDYAPTRRGGPVAGETQLVPIVIGRKANTQGAVTKTKGYGRFATISEVAVTMYKYKPNAASPTELRAAVILEPFNPTPGNASWSPNVRYVIEGLEDFQVGGAAFGGERLNMGFPKPTGSEPNLIYPSNWVTSRVGFSGGGHKRAFMGLGAAFKWWASTSTDQPKKAGVTNAEGEYPFYTIKGPGYQSEAANSSFDFLPPRPKEGRDWNLRIKIYSGFERSRPGKLLANISWFRPSTSTSPRRLRLSCRRKPIPVISRAGW
jgi:hypothetical protein